MQCTQCHSSLTPKEIQFAREFPELNVGPLAGWCNDCQMVATQAYIERGKESERIRREKTRNHEGGELRFSRAYPEGQVTAYYSTWIFEFWIIVFSWVEEPLGVECTVEEVAKVWYRSKLGNPGRVLGSLVAWPFTIISWLLMLSFQHGMRKEQEERSGSRGDQS